MKRIYKEIPTAFCVKEKLPPFEVSGEEHLTYVLTSLGGEGGAMRKGENFLSSHPIGEDPGWKAGDRVVRDIKVQQNCEQDGTMDHDYDRFLKSHPGTMGSSDGGVPRGEPFITRDGDLIIEETTYPYMVKTDDGRVHRFDKDGKYLTTT